MADSPHEGAYISWTEKYRPGRLDHLTGHINVIRQLRSWASAWKDGKPPKKKALILEGDAGIGKTTAAMALANEFGWDVVELNASDARNLESIRKIVTRGAMSRDITDVDGFSGRSPMKLKMILLDEADNLYERGASVAEGPDVGDRGGKRAIIELIKLTKHPVILIVNNLYGLTSGAGSSLNFTCEKIRFRKLSPASIAKRLRQICESEGVMYTDDVIMAIAERSGGDMRSAVSDLQIISTGKQRIRVVDLDVLGYRDTKENIFKVLEKVFNARSLKASRAALRDMDEDINTLMLWMAENVPVEMGHPADLDRAYAVLSRADVYLGRVRRKQNYKLWSYAKDTIATLPISKHFPQRGGGRYNFPSYLKSMSRTKDSRARLMETARELGKLTHTSIRYQKEDALQRMGLLCLRDPEFASHLLSRTSLGKDHLKLLTRGKLNEKEMRSIIEGAESIRSTSTAPREIGGGLASFINEEEEKDTVKVDIAPEPEEKEEKEKAPHQASLFEF